jgi:hypothetical protein
LSFLGRDLDDIPFEAIMQCYPRRGAIHSTIGKMFCEKEPNAIHRCLYSSLKCGMAQSLITTNYDLAFDSLAESDPHCVTVFDEAGFDNYCHLRSVSPSAPRVYFKIHGTAAPGAVSASALQTRATLWAYPSR